MELGESEAKPRDIAQKPTRPLGEPVLEKPEPAIKQSVIKRGAPQKPVSDHDIFVFSGEALTGLEAERSVSAMIRLGPY